MSKIVYYSMFKNVIEDKIGKFPLRMLVIMVKIDKVLMYKKELLHKLTLINNCALRAQLFTSECPKELQTHCYEILLQLKSVDGLLLNYLNALDSYDLVNSLGAKSLYPSDQPSKILIEATHKSQEILSAVMLKKFYYDGNSNKRFSSEMGSRIPSYILNFIEEAVRLMFFIRKLRHLHKPASFIEINLIEDALNRLKATISPRHQRLFDTQITVHIKELLNLITPKIKIIL